MHKQRTTPAWDDHLKINCSQHIVIVWCYTGKCNNAVKYNIAAKCNNYYETYSLQEFFDEKL